ncbi:hypothetical protein GCM10025867_51050 (plasmid) [Frondihabitans sucicola]|uniref:DUF222 domain-containing protein n=1 Tax=Frondihabitans sucicola TaxID=1268041 RepID=A0ABN6Y6D4_9MICO|nr:hypothetical protein [Frondihabitans sucicola]BDZ52298.1 hypothetical protein GCM10025867_45390 [Frondihabitans sucicola]BDZ52864.1 hypothetical protein GCM10025867_51050 [Frondihabitans sucicola]
MTAIDTTSLEARIVEALRDGRRSSIKARNSAASPIEFSNALRLTRALASTGGPFGNSADALGRAILVFTEVETSSADPEQRRSYGARRVAILDELLELRSAL